MTEASPPADRPGPLLLAVVGMDERQLAVFEMVIARHRSNEIRIVAEAAAQACLLDLDSVRAGDRLAELRRRPQPMPLLLVSVQRPADDVVGDDLFVAKPIATDALLEALAALGRRCVAAAEAKTTAMPTVDEPVPIPPAPTTSVPTAVAPTEVTVPPPTSDDHESYFLGSAGDVDTGDAAQLPRIFYEPVRYLQGLVAEVAREAADRRQAALIRGPWPAITLLPTSGLAKIAGSIDDLRVHGVQPDMASRAKVSFLPQPTGTQAQADAVPFDILMWTLSLWASRGRLPVRTALDRPVRLRVPPDFARLPVTPAAPRIAIFWASQPATLAETPRLLQLPQRQVFGFYSAAKALDLVEEVVPQAVPESAVAEAANPQYVPGSFARRFLAKLRGNG